MFTVGSASGATGSSSYHNTAATHDSSNDGINNGEGNSPGSSIEGGVDDDKSDTVGSTNGRSNHEVTLSTSSLSINGSMNEDDAIILEHDKNDFQKPKSWTELEAKLRSHVLMKIM